MSECQKQRSGRAGVGGGVGGWEGQRQRWCKTGGSRCVLLREQKATEEVHRKVQTGWWCAGEDVYAVVKDAC